MRKLIGLAVALLQASCASNGSHTPLEGDSYQREGSAEAARFLRIAAEQGNADAQSNLGAMYDNGQGVPQDFQEAVRWFRLAADQGDAGAQYNFGQAYANGQGVARDDVEAKRWFGLAADQVDASDMHEGSKMLNEPR